MNRTMEIEVKECEVEPEELEAGPVLSKKYEDRVQWTAPKDKKFTICFNHDDGHTSKSPFKDASFEVTSDKPANSGPVRADADTGDYHYEIRDGLVACPAVGKHSPKVRIKR